jgi:ubiquinone/menaquinone biosynthesis C-methylase UbiE
VGGYTNITNIDLSSVVINQQAARFPEQQWLTMDVLNMAFSDESFPYVIDKSLIDTLLCYPDR